MCNTAYIFIYVIMVQTIKQNMHGKHVCFHVTMQTYSTICVFVLGS